MFNGTQFNAFAKRLQSALKRRNISVSLSAIKESISNLIAEHDNQLTDEVQHLCLDSLICKYQPNALVEPESVIESVVCESEKSHTDTRAIVQSERQTHDIVSSKASSMGIVLSESDVVAIANQLDYQVDSSVEDVIAEAEELLIAYADHKKQQSKDKVDSMLNRVYRRVVNNNSEVTQHLSNGLQQFATDLDSSNRDFKRQARAALSRLRLPTT